MIGLGVGGYYLGTQKREPANQIQQSTNNNPQKVSSISQSSPAASTLRKMINAPKVKGEFPLKTYNGYQYKLQWEGYEIKDGQEGFNDIYMADISAPVNLVRSQNSEEQIVKQSIFPLNSGGPGGYFEIISNVPDTSKVYLRQGFEGTDTGDRILLDLSTGRLIRSSEWQKKSGKYCGIIPMNSKEQRAEVYFCNVNDSGVESAVTSRMTLHAFDFLSEKDQVLLELPRGQTLNCKDAYISTSHKYLDDNTLEIKICDQNRKIIETKTVTF